MTEFIGARISLISKSDIRYVGTLHEINSSASTVALENVTSFGTEGRRGNADEEIPSSDNVYEYIVFRGSDVKDLRIEGPPVAKENRPPTPPNDPAIMSSSGSRPAPVGQGPPAQRQGAPASQSTPQASQASQAPPATQGPQQPAPSQGPSPPAGPPPYGHQNPQYPPFYPGPPMPQGWGRGGPVPPFGMPYGAPPPPGWFPPPGQGFPPGPPGHFPPYGYPPQNQHFQQQQALNQTQSPRPAPIGPGSNKPNSPPSVPGLDKQVEPKSLAKPVVEMAASSAVSEASKDTANADQPTKVATTAGAQKSVDQHLSASQNAATTKAGSTAQKPNRVQPAIPLRSPAAIKAPLQSSGGTTSQQTQAIPASLKDATQAATAAVAAAMAKLPNSGQTNGNAMDNLTKKVNEMRTNEPIRAPRNPGSSGDRGGFERGRGRGRGGAPRNSAQKVDVPATDFDFETSNAKFSKEDLVKEAIAGSPLGEQDVASPADQDTPAPAYSKTTSFFDNISSDHKDRMEASGGGKPGGREWRGEEQKKNVETFGQGSVDNGYRGGFRGRGRGRGRGGFRRGNFGGTGQPVRENGGYRGGSSEQ